MTNNSNKVTILGTGTSTGIPTLGCNCQVCLDPRPENKRLRSSVFIETKSNLNILVDTGPDLRTQLLKENIKRIDAAILTHDHADHSHGIDDLRPFCFFQKTSIPVYTHQDCIKTMTPKFDYIFDQENFLKDRIKVGGGLPKLHFEEVDEGPCKILGKENMNLFFNPHGYTKSIGLIHERMAYIIDAQEINETNLELLSKSNIKILIIDCVRNKPHTTHLHLDLALEYIQRIKPEFAGLTHLSHDFEHFDLLEKVQRRVGNHVRPLVDGDSFHY